MKFSQVPNAKVRLVEVGTQYTTRKTLLFFSKCSVALNNKVC